MLAIAANLAGGKGTEDIGSYRNCQLVLCDIDNIHVMRNSLISLTSAIYSHTGMIYPTASSTSLTSLSTTMSSLIIPEENLLKKVDQSGWLTHCCRVLSASVFVADKLHHEKSSVLVHCSDGWDRTAQICSLAQLLLDPYYRTITGLAILIEKEWCSFGHKFQHRCGHSDVFESQLADQRSPIFFQFLDVLHSVLLQFPSAFEYSETLLIFLADHLHSGLFGNFLGNTETERRSILLVEEKTQSLWSYVVEKKDKFSNEKYAMVSHPLWPFCGVSKMFLWERYFMRWNPFCHPKSIDAHWEDDLGDAETRTIPSQEECA
jgi:myotubularin-related protein 1/2